MDYYGNSLCSGYQYGNGDSGVSFSSVSNLTYYILVGSYSSWRNQRRLEGHLRIGYGRTRIHRKARRRNLQYRRSIHVQQVPIDVHRHRAGCAQ